MLLPLCRIDGLCQAPIKKYEFLVANIDAGINILKAISANTSKLLKLRGIEYYYYFMPIGYSIRYGATLEATRAPQSRHTACVGARRGAAHL